MSATNAFRLHCSKVGCKLQTGSIPRKKKPNDIANLSNGHLFIEPITDPEILCWTEGLINISGLPFDELMEKFERAFDVKIDISLEKLPNIRNVSGKIRVNDGIDKALHILQYTADFSYKKNSETNVVTIY